VSSHQNYERGDGGKESSQIGKKSKGVAATSTTTTPRSAPKGKTGKKRKSLKLKKKKRGGPGSKLQGSRSAKKKIWQELPKLGEKGKKRAINRPGNVIKKGRKNSTKNREMLKGLLPLKKTIPN